MRRQTVLLLILAFVLVLYVGVNNNTEGFVDGFIDTYDEFVGMFSDDNNNNSVNNNTQHNTYTPVQTTSTKKPNTSSATKKTKTTKTTDRGNNEDPTEELVLKDKRIPDYKQTHSPQYKDIPITWTSHDNMHKFTITTHIDKYMYEYYRSLSRYYDPKDYQKYMDDTNNREIVKSIADSIKQLSNDAGFDESETALEAISYVQAIQYMYDKDSTGQKDFPKYPLETLYDLSGDCEDSSILLAAILRELNFGMCLIVYDDHVAVGVKGADDLPGTYFNVDDVKYYYVESTGQGWEVGNIPDDYKDKKAKIIKITQ